MIRSRWSPKTYDVIVCGAGSAGCAASYAAARAGARTLLVERLGFCGGTPIAGAIHTLDAVVSCEDNSQYVVGGFASEFISEVLHIGGAATDDNPSEALVLHPEYMKVAYDTLLGQAGVETVFHALAIDAQTEGRQLLSVELGLLDGRASVRANTFIDCTGDAAVAFQARAAWQMDGDLQALTYHFRIGNVEENANWEQMESACRAAVDRCAPKSLLYGGPWIIRLNKHEISLNTTRALGNPTDPLERTRAEQQARANMLEIVGILLREVPVLKDSYLLTGATDLHVRESRKIIGAYTLTDEDILSNRMFPDAIAYGAWPFDIHPTDGFVGVHPHKEDPPRPYGIPYRCLVPRDVDGLLIAGKSISTTHRAHGSTRVPGTSMATGQAAGVAAALAARGRIAVRDVDIHQLREELAMQGAILPPVTAGAV